MSFIEEIKKRAKDTNKTIVLPEYNDKRIIEAASICLKEDICKIVIIGNDNCKNKGFNIDKAKIINPRKEVELTNTLAKNLYKLRKDKGMTYDMARKLLIEDYNYFACMYVKMGFADGVVSGACHSSADTLRPALQIIKTKRGVNKVSAFFMMMVPDCEYGLDGTFLFADSGLIQDPDPKDMVDIAKSSSESFELLTKKKAKVAFISHSTHGSAKHELVDKVVTASALFHKKCPDVLSDGELQIDAAIVPEVAKMKCPDSPLKGKANCLIFPNLDSGNSAYKLVQRLAKADAYGPITQGMHKPVNDLSRGCSANDIVGVIAITCIQA